jgi:predicted metalloendopeptidase
LHSIDSKDKVFYKFSLQLSTPPENRRDAKVWYNKMSFTKFFELTSNKVDWLNLANRIYKAVNSSVQLSPQEFVIVEDIPYYKGVTQLLEKTPKRVIANYLGWMIAMSLGDYTVEKFRKNEFEFQIVNSGVEQQTELWRICATYLETALQYAVSRKYVDENFTKKDKEEVRDIFLDNN